MSAVAALRGHHIHPWQPDSSQAGLQKHSPAVHSLKPSDYKKTHLPKSICMLLSCCSQCRGNDRQTTAQATGQPTVHHSNAVQEVQPAGDVQQSFVDADLQ